VKCPWYKIDLGSACGDIYTLSKQAVEIAKLLDTEVSFDFNGVKVNASAKTCPTKLATDACDAVGKGIKSIYGEGF
jgi:hypothetical protein